MAAIKREAPRNGLLCLILYTTLWLVLSNNQGWLFGSVVILLAVILSWHLKLNLIHFRPLRFPAFFGFYLKESLSAGLQVARAACHPRMAVKPGWVSFDLKSQSLDTHMMLAAFVCLLPGTLASKVENEKMHIHLLDEKRPWRPTVEKLESRLMWLLGETEP